MTDDEIFEWYKNGAPKTDGMTDKDYELNMGKGLNSQNNKLLSDNLAKQQNSLATAQKNAQQSASINNDKLMRYLGVQNAEAGIGSLQTSSDALRANNNYSQNRATISNNVSEQNAELLQQYSSNKLQNDTNFYNNQMALLDKYKSSDYQAERDAIADERYKNEWDYNVAQDEYAKKQAEGDFNHAYEMQNKLFDLYLEDGVFSDQEKAEADEYLSKFAGLSEGNQQKLRDNLDYYKSSAYNNSSTVKEAVKDVEKANRNYGDFTTTKAPTKAGHNFDISFGGKGYGKVELGSKASDEISTAAKSLINNTVFMHDNNVYVKTSDKVYRVGGTGKNKYDNDGDRYGKARLDSLKTALTDAGFILKL